MPYVRPFFGLILAVATLGSIACRSSRTASEASTAATPDQGSPESPCFLRGATLEEAASRPSPLGQVTFTFGDGTATLCYGRPSARGRTVMGELVPFGEPWRMGANEATVLHLPFAAQVGGVALEPGSYSLYAVPGEREWEIVVNGSAARWGVPISDEVRAQDVGSFTRPATDTDRMVETLTYVWESHGEGMGHLVMEWEDTRVEIPVHGPGRM